MKKVWSLVLGLIVFLCFVACADNSKKSDMPDMPIEKEIIVVREGEEEVFTGTLFVNNTMGYAVYLLPDYELRKSGESDLIAPKSESELSSEINMLIYEVNSDKPIPEGDNEHDYRRFIVEDKTLEMKLSYPSEAVEGGVVLLHAMADTICKAK